MKRGYAALALLLLTGWLAGCAGSPQGANATASLTYADPAGLADTEELSRLCALGGLELIPAETPAAADVWIVPAQSWRQYLGEANFRSIPSSLYEGCSFFSAKAGGMTQVFGHKGQLMAVPRSLWAGYQGRETFLFFRKDWATRLGYEGLEGGDLQWQTWIDLMTDFVRADPDGDAARNTAGLTLSRDWDALMAVLLDNCGVRDWVLQDGVWVPGLTSERAKQAFGWLSQFMREGLLTFEPEATTPEQALEAFVQGKTGLWAGNDPEAVEAAWRAAHPEATGPLIETLSVLALPEGPYGVRFTQGQPESAVLLFASGVSDEAVTVALRTMDQFLEARAHTDTSTWPASCRSVRQVRWYDYAWRQPMFTDYTSDETIQGYTQALEQAASREWLTLADSAGDPEVGWQQWLTICQGIKGGPEAAARVAQVAAEWGVQQEE